jgi:hypothetical protein
MEIVFFVRIILEVKYVAHIVKPLDREWQTTDTEVTDFVWH